jgi:hypothetical protein
MAKLKQSTIYILIAVSFTAIPIVLLMDYGYSKLKVNTYDNNDKTEHQPTIDEQLTIDERPIKSTENINDKIKQYNADKNEMNEKIRKIDVVIDQLIDMRDNLYYNKSIIHGELMRRTKYDTITHKSKANTLIEKLKKHKENIINRLSLKNTEDIDTDISNANNFLTNTNGGGKCKTKRRHRKKIKIYN